MTEGKRLEGRFQTVPSDRSQESEKEMGLAIRHTIDFLTRAQEQSMVQAARLGTRPLNLNRVLTNLKYSDSSSIPDARALFDMLFEGGVSPPILQTLYDDLDVNFPDGRGLESNLTRYFFGSRVVAQANLNFKIDLQQRVGGSHPWLQEWMREQFEKKKVNLEKAHQVQAIASDIALKYGTAAAPMVRLMYMCMDVPKAIDNLRLLAEARQEENAIRNKDEPSFFDKMRDFIGVYCDISTKVIRHARQSTKHDLDNRAKSVLSRFLISEQLHVAHIKPGDRPPDPFVEFTRFMRAENENPWILGDALDTPFNAKEFDQLLTPEVPRGLVADAAFFLNNYREALFIQNIHQLLKGVEQYQQESLIYKQKTGKDRPAISQNLSRKIDDTLAKISSFTGETYAITEISEKLKMLESFSERQSRSLSAFSVLIRILDPERIVRSVKFKQEFDEVLSMMPKFGSEDDPRKIEIFASSVQALDQKTDPFLDVPLIGIEGNYSIRMQVIKRSEENWFDPDILAKGPYARSSDPRNPPKGPLFRPRDAIGHSPEDILRLRNNFNSAAGASWINSRPWLDRAGDAMSKLKNSYELIKSYTRGEIESHYHIGGDHEVAFFPSPHDAMRYVVSGLFPRLSRDSYIITSTQEFEGMTEPFTEQGVRVIAVNCNQSASAIFADIQKVVDREGRAPTATLFSSKTRLGGAVASVPTIERLNEKGERVVTGAKIPNSIGMADLYDLVNTTYPETKNISDDVQSVGRNDIGQDLSRSRCDVLITGGGKALGIKNIGVAIIRKSPGEGTKIIEQGYEGREYIEGTIKDFGEEDFLGQIREERLKEQHKVWSNPLPRVTPSGTVDSERIAAFGIALQHLNSKIDTAGTRQNMERDLNLTERQRVAECMQELTKIAKNKAARYAIELLINPEFPFRNEITEADLANPDVLEQFGCQVVEPAHEKVVDYFGVISVTFPNLGDAKKTGDLPVRSNYLGRALEKLGMPILQVGRGGNAWRISFIPTHLLPEVNWKDDINRIFSAITNAHIEYLKREVEKHRIENFAELRERTPNIQMKDWKEQ